MNIDSLLNDGWILDHKCENSYYIVPTDHRRGWGAIWEPVQYKSMTIYVPNWAC